MEKVGESRATRNYHLDAIRGLSAIVVVFNHIRELFFPNYQRGITGPLRIIYMDHYVAGLAVMIFFVLSGYLVGGGAVRRIESQRWSWPDYLLSRLTRLYVVLIPALVATALIDLVGRRHGGVAAGIFTSMFDYQSLLGSLFFLQIRLTPVFGSDGPLWSLSYEFWFYIVFPLLLLTFWSKSKVVRLVNFLTMVALSVSLRWIMDLFPCWLLGVGVFYLIRFRPKPSALARTLVFSVSILLMLGALILETSHLVTNIIVIFSLDALCAAPLIWSAAVSGPEDCPSWYKVAAVFVSDISYTLYLTHAPLLALVKLVWLREAHWPADGMHVLLSLLPFGIALAYAYLMYRLFESRTEEVRGWIRRRLRRLEIPGIA